jgi:NADH:ubiquinone oxidoreductase subunit 3 (subunit A)
MFYYFLVTFLFVVFLWFLVLNLSYSITLFEKASQYECGFEPFGFNSAFDLQYFLIGLLYLVFDVELVLVIPWLFSFSVMPVLGLCSMFFFLILFVLGLIYEWKKNVLHWT